MLCAATLAVSLFPQDSSGQVGTRAPALDVEVIRSPGQSDAIDFGTQAVAIEFWASWCAPCVRGIPRWNALVDEFAGEPIAFVSVTSESREAVEDFLEDRDIKGAVALDPARRTFERYRVHSIPRTVLVDAKGVVRAITRIEEVDSESLTKLIAGEDPGLADASLTDRARLHAAELVPDSSSLDQLSIIRPSTGEIAGAVENPQKGFAKYFGFDAKGLLARAHGVSTQRLLVEAALPATRYDAAFQCPNDPEALQALMQASVAAAFGVRADVEVAMESTLAIFHDSRDTSIRELSDAGGNFWQAEGELGGVIAKKELLRRLEVLLRRPLVDRTGLSGTLVVNDITWDPGVPGDLERVLHVDLGLTLDVVQVPVYMIAIRDAATKEPRSRQFGLYSKLVAHPGRRDELVAILSGIEPSLKRLGCLSYVVSLAAADPDTVWVTEVWISREAHAGSLQHDEVLKAIQGARPLLTDQIERIELDVVGGSSRDGSPGR